jgi:hypothetical protein
MNGTDSDSCTGPPAGLQLTTASPLADGWRPRQTARATPHQVDGRTTPVTATTTRTPFCPAWPMHVGPPRCRCARNSSPFMDTGLPERGRRPARQAHRKRLHQHKRPAGSPSAAASPSWTSGSAASTITLACSSSCGWVPHGCTRYSGWASPDPRGCRRLWLHAGPCSATGLPDGAMTRQAAAADAVR